MLSVAIVAKRLSTQVADEVGGPHTRGASCCTWHTES
jgi:hypothetical protein